jgi:hypothetical protein
MSGRFGRISADSSRKFVEKYAGYSIYDDDGAYVVEESGTIRGKPDGYSSVEDARRKIDQMLGRRPGKFR